MAAGEYNFTVEQGTTMDIPITWRDGSNNPVNLTGYTARMQARETLAASTTLFEWTTENSRIELGGATGVITIKATAVETAGFSWPIPAGQTNPQGVYDLELISGTGVVTRLLKGTITIDREVTRT